MRIVYQDKKLLVSLTDEEVDKFYKNKHFPVEIPIGSLTVLHQDINKAMNQAHLDNLKERYFGKE
jgi:predicted DNA-binding transcriptional regulator AlpA